MDEERGRFPVALLDVRCPLWMGSLADPGMAVVSTHRITKNSGCIVSGPRSDAIGARSFGGDSRGPHDRQLGLSLAQRPIDLPYVAHIEGVGHCGRAAVLSLRSQNLSM